MELIKSMERSKKRKMNKMYLPSIDVIEKGKFNPSLLNSSISSTKSLKTFSPKKNFIVKSSKHVDPRKSIDLSRNQNLNQTSLNPFQVLNLNKTLETEKRKNSQWFDDRYHFQE